jgi:quercetin dioxygenase-like cupin family protein
MQALSKWATAAALVTCMAAVTHHGNHAQPPSDSTQVKTLVQAQVTLSQALPSLDGSRLKASLVEVTYAPGGYSAPHSHPCPVIVYVLQGTLREQVQGEPEAVYKAGQSFYEPPGGVHMVSHNESKTEPAKFLAYFICDNDRPLSTPLSAGKPEGGK